MPVSKDPRVSVLLPVCNGAATLARALASIRAQTWTDWELIVVDDGSIDATPDLLAEIAHVEPRLRVLTQAHGGIVAALQAGLAVARGEFIARMDADDEAFPERLAAQVELLRAGEGGALGLVSCLVEFGGDRRANEGYALHVDWINGLVTPEEIARHRFVESPLAHPSVLFRRELLARHGGYRAGDFPEDYELWLRWLDAGVRMAKVPKVLLRWNDPPARLSRTATQYAPEAFFRTKAQWLAHEVARIGRGRPVYVWGAGRPTRKRAAYLAAHGLTLAGYIDVDAKKIMPALGGSGLPVLAPTALPPPERAVILGYVSKRGARDLIRGQLLARGYREGSDFLMCA